MSPVRTSAYTGIFARMAWVFQGLLKGVNTPADEKDALKFISRTSLTKSILSIIIFLGFDYISSINHNLKIPWEAPVVLITIALLTYFNVDLFRWATFQIVLCQSSNQTVNALRLSVASLKKRSHSPGHRSI